MLGVLYTSGRHTMIIDLVNKAVLCALFTSEEKSFRESGTDSHGEEGLDLTTQLWRPE